MKTIQKECQVVLIPTDKIKVIPNIFKNSIDNSVILNKNPFLVMTEDKEWIHQHLYILSNEEIKDGDWCFNLLNDKIAQSSTLNQYNGGTWKKIIATTNPEVTKYRNPKKDVPAYLSLPKPTDEFIQEWIAKGCPEKINVEYEEDYSQTGYSAVNGNILKISSDNTITCSFIEDDWLHSQFKSFMAEDNNRTAYEFYKYLKQNPPQKK